MQINKDFNIHSSALFCVFHRRLISHRVTKEIILLERLEIKTPHDSVLNFFQNKTYFNRASVMNGIKLVAGIDVNYLSKVDPYNLQSFLLNNRSGCREDPRRV